MNTLKIDKRFEEELAGIRKAAEALPPGKKNAVLNKCAKLSLYAQKAQRQLEAPHYRRANYDARTQEDMAAQARAKKAVFQAMVGGRHVDLTMADEFQVSQMHTAISQIRKDIYKKNLPYYLCDEWVRPGEGARPYKRYWLEDKPQEGQKDAV